PGAAVARKSAAAIDHWPRAGHSLHCVAGEVRSAAWRGNVLKVAAGMLGVIVLAMLEAGSTALGEDDFPLVGTYTENQACKGDASDASASKVKITPRDIDSV